jgi:hypothetical protein
LQEARLCLLRRKWQALSALASFCARVNGFDCGLLGVTVGARFPAPANTWLDGTPNVGAGVDTFLQGSPAHGSVGKVFCAEMPPSTRAS